MNAPATQSGSGDTAQLFNNVSNAYKSIESGDWVSGGLGIANAAMSMVGNGSNPLSGFLAAGFSWAIQHVDFLREPFDVLLGSPESIAKMSESFKSAGKQVKDIGTEYQKICVSQTREWQGKAADGYRAAAKRHATGLETLAKSVDGIAGAVKGAGELVGTVRKMIMDLISQAVSDMVMKIIQWLAASFLTFGAAIAGAIADIVTTAVNYAKKLSDFLQKLVGSVQKLMKLIQSVSQIAKAAETIIDAISTMANQGKGGGGGAPVRQTSGGFDGIRAGDQSRASSGAGGTFTSGSNPGYAGGGPNVADGLGNTRPAYAGSGNTGGYQGPYGQGPGVGAGPAVTPVYTPPGGQGGGAGGGAGSGGQYLPGPGTGSGAGTGAGTGTGTGRWVPGHWEPGTTTTAGGNATTKPPTFGATPTTSTNADWYRPTTTDHAATAAAGGGGGGGGGGVPKGMGGGGGGGMPAGFGGGPAGGGGAGGTSATQFGGAAGVMAAGSGNAPAAPAAAAGGAPRGAGGAGAGGMMGGAPMAGGAGQQGGSNEHKRKVRIEGEALVDPPKAAKPVIGE
ncbi:WXG100 family type VII secretion target [Lentzea sp. NPDC092896]|uniref:WXG100 family type VII secretion target n=1 Tax=Lentzea sp. NPDC092896 TaxID=3364127 RepID=UPI00381E6AAB